MIRRLTFLLVLTCATASPAAMVVKNLKCEYRTNPLGVDSPKPRLSWTLESDRRGDVQSAYQVVVKDDAGGELWDSGKVASDVSINIEYAGEPLAAGSRVSWKVRAWDRVGA